MKPALALKQEAVVAVPMAIGGVEVVALIMTAGVGGPAAAVADNGDIRVFPLYLP